MKRLTDYLAVGVAIFATAIHTPMARAAGDGTLAVGAMTASIWLQYFDSGVHVFMQVGGVLLLALRILVAIRDVIQWFGRRK